MLALVTLVQRGHHIDHPELAVVEVDAVGGDSVDAAGRYTEPMTTASATTMRKSLTANGGKVQRDTPVRTCTFPQFAGQAATSRAATGRR